MQNFRSLLADFNKLSSWKQSSNFNAIYRTLFSEDRLIAPQTGKLKQDFTLFDRTDIRAPFVNTQSHEKSFIWCKLKNYSAEDTEPSPVLLPVKLFATIINSVQF